ncbi:hypothetical protein QBC38DRAFT_126015 [Podospora fimiseda]|uniref:DUF7730 domain-containing protein n=1 Tax=Podospora fimiseda TaxID=252190 RepID=A0AAN6YPC5_9PEZI|nr:hypothetical protein QBC38DRAFT_126015 [Podospora fimiseda]
MGKLRDIFQNLKISNRQNEPLNHVDPEPPTPPHALDTLPTLPSPRRPITPLPPNPQLSSSFFSLPPELRLQIYRLLFSSREIHLDMRYSATESSIPHSTKGAIFGVDRIWRWRASTCHRHPQAFSLQDRCTWGGAHPTACSEYGTPCGVGKEMMGMLLSCRLGYREVVQVIYAENTFHVTAGAVVLYNQELMPVERSREVRKLIYKCTVETVWDYAVEHLRVKRGVHAYRALMGGLARNFPGLRELEVVLMGDAALRIVRGQGVAVTPSEVVRDVKEVLLGPVDEMVRGFGQKVDCVLVMSEGSGEGGNLKEEFAEGAERSEGVEGKWIQFWRGVEGSKVNEGYWIRFLSLVEQRWYVPIVTAQFDEQLAQLTEGGN